MFCLILGENVINCFPSIYYVISEMMKTCFIVYLFCGMNSLLQNQIICLRMVLLCNNEVNLCFLVSISSKVDLDIG